MDSIAEKELSNPDLLVIGAGPGGYIAALRGAQLGMQVTLAEEHKVGGTCLNYGCIPTKALLASTELYAGIQKAADYGIEVDRVSAHIEKMMARKDKIVSRLVKGVEYLLSQNGVKLLRGKACFKNHHQVEVATADGRCERITAKNIIIATGSVPLQIPGVKPNGQEIITSKEALALKTIPAKLAIIGAGVVGLEIGTIYHRLGSEVTIVEMLDSLLPNEDKEITDIAARLLRRQGIKILLGKKVARAEILPEGVELSITDNEKLFAEKVLVAVGRKPNTNGLGLENVTVATNDKGWIKVNSHMQTSVSRIYAIGDVVGGKLLAHKASKEGEVAVESAHGSLSEMDYRVIPNCIFTSPEIASVGLTEEEAKKEGFEIQIGRFPFKASGRAATIGENEGMVKVVVAAGSEKLLGVHIIGPQADVLIAEAALALKMGAKAQDLAETVHAHPTLPESMMEAALNVYKRAFHIINE